MTYKEKFDELERNYREKSELHLKADAKLTAQDGFKDTFELENLFKSHQEAVKAGEEFYSFLAFIRKHRVNPDDTFGE